MQISFDISYENLNITEQYLFQVIGLFPGSDFTPASCAAMVGVDTECIYDNIDILFQQSLLREVKDDRYRVHDLLRDYSRKKYFSAHDSDMSPINQLVRFYIKCIKCCCKILYPFSHREYIDDGYIWNVSGLPEDRSSAFEWLSDEIENIFACLNLIRNKNWNTLYFSLSYVLLPYILKRLSGWRVIEICEYLTSCNDIDRWMSAASLSALGNAYQQVGNFDDAVSFYKKSEDLWRDVSNNAGLADTLTSHCFTLERLGRYDEALDVADEALRYQQSIGDYHGIANVMNCRGAIFWRMKQYNVAKQIFEEVIEIRNKIGDTFGATNSINNWAFTMLKLGDEKTAREGFAKSLALARSNKDYSGESVTLNNLGYTEILAQNPDVALSRADEAYDVALRIGDEYQIGRSYDVKGKAFLLNNNYSSSIECFQLSLKYFDKLNVPEAMETIEILSRLNSGLHK